MRGSRVGTQRSGALRVAASQAAVTLRPEEGNTTGFFYHGAQRGVKRKVAMDVVSDAKLRDDAGDRGNRPMRRDAPPAQLALGAPGGLRGFGHPWQAARVT